MVHKQKRMKPIWFLPILLLWVVSCKEAEERSCSEVDYALSSAWYDNGKAVDRSKADVFYILPTCIFDWEDSSGEVHHYADIADAQQREQMRPSYELADAIFGDSANFFAPYYRQISLNSWMEGDAVVEKRFPQTMADIKAAFDYYMEHLNGGRKFVLAGSSQGGKGVVELVKAMSDDDFNQMAAAYVIGYRITQEDMDQSPRLVLATGRTDRGVTVCYNSVTDLSALSPVVSQGNVAVINPVNWATDERVAPLNDTVSVRIDSGTKALLVTGLDPGTAYEPSLSSLFKKGNLHLLELTLYQEQLTENVKERLYPD